MIQNELSGGGGGAGGWQHGCLLSRKQASFSPSREQPKKQRERENRRDEMRREEGWRQKERHAER